MHDAPSLSAPSHLQDAAHDIRCNFRMRRVLVFARRLQIVLQTRLPESHQGLPMLLYGLRLPDGSGDASDADFHNGLVVVISLVVLVEIKRRVPSTSGSRPHCINQKA